MADTIRSDYPEKFCAWCGSKGCHLQHWGPLFKGKVVFLDNCAIELRSVDDNGVEPRFNCDTGEEINATKPTN